jgi:hypothetical protein
MYADDPVLAEGQHVVATAYADLAERWERLAWFRRLAAD